MNNKIVICNNNFIYIIDKEPYETDENTYIRGWYIIQNFDKFSNKNELISNSLIYLNEKKNNMKYIY